MKDRDTIARYAFYDMDGYYNLMQEVVRRRGLDPACYSIDLSEVIETVEAMTDEELLPFLPKED